MTPRPGLRTGFTLVELLVGMTLAGAAATIACRLLVVVERVTDAESVRGDLQSTLRNAALVTQNELRQLSAGPPGPPDLDADIIAVSDTSISYRALRAYYVVCAAPESPTAITVDRSAPSDFGAEIRAPAAGDSLFLFVEGDSTQSADDRWIRLAISAVSAAPSSCRSQWGAAPRPGYTFTLGAPGIPAPAGAAGVFAGAPVRTFERVTLKSYLSGGQRWLGMDVDGGGVQPIAGPLALGGGAPGLELRYEDSTGRSLPTTASSIPFVRGVGVVLRGVGQRPIAAGGGARASVSDSLFPFVYLRNSSPP